MPKYTIISPVYNVERYLPGFIDCVQSQTFSDFELLLVDDGSTDKSGNYCDAYVCADRRVRVIHKENGGVSSARNAGLDEATGEWILFYDPDDIISTNALEIIDKILTAYSKADVLLYNYTIVKESRSRIPGHHTVPTNKLLNKDDILRYMLGSVLSKENVLRAPWTKVYRHSILKDSGVRFSKRTFAEDYQFNLALFPHFSHAVAISDSLYDYCIHSGSAISRYHKDILNVWREDSCIELTIYDSIKSYIDKQSFIEYAKISFSSLCFAMLSVYENEDEIESILTELLKDESLKRIVDANRNVSLKSFYSDLHKAIISKDIHALTQSLCRMRKKTIFFNKMSNFKSKLKRWL